MRESISFVEHFPVKNVILNHDTYNDLEQELIFLLKEKGINYLQNVTSISAADLQLQFLNHTMYDNENDNSNVIYLELGTLKTLFMGDASTKVETDLLKQYQLSDIDILKVGHHGSKTSTSEQLIEAITPQYAFISVGKNNRYGHPSKQVLNHLRQSKVYRTDEHGSVVIRNVYDHYVMKTCIY